MESKLKKVFLVPACLSILLISGCMTNGLGPGQVIPEESRATPELALLSQNAQLADAGGDVAKAEALYKSVLRNSPNDADTWYRLGNLYANNNRPTEAAIAYERTLVADNSHARAWHNLGIIRLRQAYASMLQAQITIDPDDPLAERIDTTLEGLSRLTILDSQPRPAIVKRPAVNPASSAAPAHPVPAPSVEAPGEVAK
jgi:tetratricopeptide (TPR) repeat protein